MANMPTTDPTGLVLEIQRMSTEDGPGIRTTVFMKGCTLRCTWCHNPESISAQPQVQWIGSRCIGCKTCIDTCSQKALTLTDDGMIIDRERCIACGDCVEECPTTALELLGKAWTVDELVKEVVKDKAYFDQSEGGVTVSGGEAALQSDFVAAFFKALREQTIHTAVDTCGQCSTQALEKILPYADLVLFDLKLSEADQHKTFTGKGVDTIHSNLAFIRQWMSEHTLPRKLWIRTPIIPGATATEENVRGIGNLIKDLTGNKVSRWELCAFNNLCKDKYTRLDLDWPFKNSELMEAEDMEHLAQAARESGVDPAIVHWSGSTRLNDTDDEDQERKVSRIKGCPTC